MCHVKVLRLANPFVRAILGSRAHRLLSGTLVVVEYRGHWSGRVFRIPLRYAPMAEGSIVALAVQPERKLWWRSFLTSAPATLDLRGRRVEASGRLVEDVARTSALEAYVARFPRSARHAREAAFVVFTPAPR